VKYQICGIHLFAGQRLVIALSWVAICRRVLKVKFNFPPFFQSSNAIHCWSSFSIIPCDSRGSSKRHQSVRANTELKGVHESRVVLGVDIVCQFVANRQEAAEHIGRIERCGVEEQLAAQIVRERALVAMLRGRRQ
jgi:hypothetical protein